MGTDKRKVANVTPFPGTKIQELDATHFGSTLRRYRELAQLEQAEVARVCGVKQNAVSNWENGNIMPSVDMLIRIAGEFSVSADFLLGLSAQHTLDVSGLTDEQILHLQNVVNDMKRLQSAETG